MAVLSVLVGAGAFNTINGTKVGSATPAADDLLIVVAAHTGNTAAVAPTDDQGGTYTLINSAVKVSSGDKLTAWVRDQLAAAVLHNFSHAPGTTSGGGYLVYAASGMARAGIAAIRQSAIESNQAAGGTPTPVFGVAPLTANPVVGVVFNGTNPATLTPRASPAYGEGVDVGYNTPSTGCETMRINSGETATSIAWGSTSASEFASMVIELDTSALCARYYYDMAGSNV